VFIRNNAFTTLITQGGGAVNVWGWKAAAYFNGCVLVSFCGHLLYSIRTGARLVLFQHELTHARRRSTTTFINNTAPNGGAITASTSQSAGSSAVVTVVFSS
jgi:predicted outer membrane repeat protein